MRKLHSVNKLNVQLGPSFYQNQLSLNTGLVSEPQSQVEEDGEGEHRLRGGQGAHERGHSSVPEHQLPVSRGPQPEAEGAAGDAAEVSGGQESLIRATAQSREAAGASGWWGGGTMSKALWVPLFIMDSSS